MEGGGEYITKGGCVGGFNAAEGEVAGVRAVDWTVRGEVSGGGKRGGGGGGGGVS